MNKKHCLGCEDDFYNNKNPYKIKECMRLKTARLVLRKKVQLSQCPPFNQEPIKVPDCYRQKGYCFLNKDVKR